MPLKSFKLVFLISIALMGLALAKQRTSTSTARTASKNSPAEATTSHQGGARSTAPTTNTNTNSNNTRTEAEPGVDPKLVERLENIRNSLATHPDPKEATKRAELWKRIKQAFQDQLSDLEQNRKLKKERKKLIPVRHLNPDDYKAVMKLIATLPESDRDFFALTMTAFGEARGQGKTQDVLDKQGRAEMLAIMEVIKNRAEDGRTQIDSKTKKNKVTDIFSAATQPLQFSCWNRTDLNLLAMLLGEKTHTAGKSSYRRALQAYQDWENPETSFGGGLEKSDTCHYYAKSIAAPDWAKNKTALEKPTVVVPPPPPPPQTVIVSKAHYFHQNIAWTYKNHWRLESN